ncbi:MAG: hypothetical protein ACTSQ7_09585 [Alphaproteobacteria bacterium]
MILYGLPGFTHNGGRTLTVMSPAGATAALAEIAAGPGVATQAGPGQLTYYVEKRRGALRELVAAHEIVVLEKPAWDAKKTEFGPTVFD